MKTATHRVSIAGLASGVIHAAALLLVSESVPSRAADDSTPGTPYLVDLQYDADSESDPHLVAPPPQPGSRSEHNVDALLRGGRGGHRTGALQVTWLTASADDISLFTTPRTVWRDAQVNRLRTSTERASLDPRRATPNPANDTFVASGSGIHRLRIPRSNVDAARGGRQRPTPPARTPGHANLPRHGTAAGRLAPPSPSNPSHSAARPIAAGLQRGHSINPRSGRIATGRTPLDEGRAAVPAYVQDTQVRDRHNAELRSDSNRENWVDASPRIAQEPGSEAGGALALGAPGSGTGRVAGGRAVPRREGPGRQGQLDTGDARYVRWYLEVRQRIHRGLSFPAARALARDQGISVLRFRIARDGALVEEPRVLRTSGFGDFDAAATRAVKRAAPFPPIPEALVPDGVGSHGVRILIEHSNPMVR